MQEASVSRPLSFSALLPAVSSRARSSSTPATFASHLLPSSPSAVSNSHQARSNDSTTSAPAHTSAQDGRPNAAPSAPDSSSRRSLDRDATSQDHRHGAFFPTLTSTSTLTRNPQIPEASKSTDGISQSLAPHVALLLQTSEGVVMDEVFLSVIFPGDGEVFIVSQLRWCVLVYGYSSRR